MMHEEWWIRSRARCAAARNMKETGVSPVRRNSATFYCVRTHQVGSFEDVKEPGTSLELSFKLDVVLDTLQLELDERRCRRIATDDAKCTTSILVPVLGREPAGRFRQKVRVDEEPEWNDVEDGELDLVRVLRKVRRQLLGDDAPDDSSQSNGRL